MATGLKAAPALMKKNLLVRLAQNQFRRYRRGLDNPQTGRMPWITLFARAPPAVGQFRAFNPSAAQASL
jgi:uncharacterized protein (DUF1778 family)